MNEKEPQKVALVHDFLTAFGGAERVLQSMRKLYPEAPIYTLLFDESVIREYFPGSVVHASWLAKLPEFLRKHPRLLLLFFPAAIESLDLREYDLVISSSGAWSKGLVTRLHTKHVAYLHSPMRFAWDQHKQYLNDLKLALPFHFFGRFALSYLRIWDFQAADRPDVLLANSHFTQRRIAKYYRKESEVIYPPAFREEVSTSQIGGASREYYLVVSRLTKAKKIDLAIEAANKLGLELKVAGTGNEEKNLRKIAGKKIHFLGTVSETELQVLYRGAKALIIPSEEDFGLVAVEALSYGTPVVAYGRGGVHEIVTEGVHGCFFYEPLPEILAEALMRLDLQKENFSSDALRARAQEFGEERFLQALTKAVQEKNV